MTFFNRESLQQTLTNAKTHLFNRRMPQGYWEGELSSSALSTATAVTALWSILRKPHLLDGKLIHQEHLKKLIECGLRWLADNQNTDGGWGDTICSESNISTTVLVWCAFACNESEPEHYHSTLHQAESWIQKRAGGLNPEAIANVIFKRYGKDRTFSVPILTTCALTGRLGPDTTAWRRVIQLPFELALCPHRWFTWLRLPVVSYALPALIAIGQARHHRRPTKNPIARILRNLAKWKTLRVLREIQPSSGGYLEATPLTSFVTMSLASFLDEPHSVITDALRFLIDSAKPDGSWAIDTNLATWVTTLSINALAKNPRFPEKFSDGERNILLDWLLNQQYRTLHPYTNAAPGGWAWTPLPGGVPDADDTAGALLALKNLYVGNEEVIHSVQEGIGWLANLQNRDGGVPTFCRGWTNLPFDRSCPDITAHALRAMAVWYDSVNAGTQSVIQRFQGQALEYLRNTQQSDGAWAPLWFGNEREEKHINWTYGTAQVTSALITLYGLHKREDIESVSIMLHKGVAWLLGAQSKDGTWGGAPGITASIEETSLATEALASFATAFTGSKADAAMEAALKGASWLMVNTENGQQFEAAPIGFYFAELWYFECLYPVIFSIAGLESVLQMLDKKSVSRLMMRSGSLSTA